MPPDYLSQSADELLLALKRAVTGGTPAVAVEQYRQACSDIVDIEGPSILQRYAEYFARRLLHVGGGCEDRSAGGEAEVSRVTAVEAGEHKKLEAVADGGAMGGTSLGAQ
jgi:hypothetical protein